MSRVLTIPDERRFVRALALAVDPDDALSLLPEVGTGPSQALGLIRQVREALNSAHDQASERQEWQVTHTGVTGAGERPGYPSRLRPEGLEPTSRLLLSHSP